jgi:peptidoglycan-associated lipoprotein
VRTLLDRSVVATVIVGLILAAGCAKRPVATVSSAPAPAPAPTAPPPAVAAPAPSPSAVAGPTPPPAPRPSPPKDYRAHEALTPIYFDFDTATVRPGDVKILDANAAWLNANPRYLVLIEGHCDERGTSNYNLALGDRRAKAAINHLVARGIKSDRITIVSYGEERPVCTEHNETCRSKNRRAQFLIKER